MEIPTMALTFYYGSGSPFAWKVWLALEHKAVPYDLKVLSFDKGDTRAPAFRAINPRGKVPTLVDDGYALWESAAILEYLDEAYPERPLLPKDLNDRATVRRIAAEAENYLGPLVADLFGATLFRTGPEDPEAFADLHQRLDEELPRFAAMLDGEYFGKELSLADFTVYPHLRLIPRVDERQPGQEWSKHIPSRLAAWMKRIEDLPYYEKTIPPHWKA
jgi:glutathione S-transferase